MCTAHVVMLSSGGSIVRPGVMWPTTGALLICWNHVADRHSIRVDTLVRVRSRESSHACNAAIALVVCRIPASPLGWIHCAESRRNGPFVGIEPTR